MPFHVVKSKRAKDKFDVENADTNEVKNIDPYDSEAKAQEYSNALNAHSSDKVEAPVMLKFVQLTKVDAKTGEVWGSMATETPDDVGEICDYEHSKPNFLKWSDKIVKASGGKSKGNVRTMHNGQLEAVGKLIHFEARDDKKDFFVGAQIVDKQALEKVYQGVYTGFSIGGSYGAWSELDGGHKRYEAVPVEVSLVDNPCNPDATFQMVKEDGVEELRKFVSVKKEDAMTEPKVDTLEEQMEKLSQEELQKLATKLNELITKPDLVKDAPAADGAKDDGGATDEPKPADSGESAKAPSTDDLRAVILGILEELGLVVKEGDTMKVAQPKDLQKSVEALDLVKADLVTKHDELSKLISDGDKALAGDIAKLITANDDLSVRVEKVTGMGPVVQIPSGDPVYQVTQEIEVLKKYQASAKTPAEVAQFGELIAAAEIRIIQNPKK